MKKILIFIHLYYLNQASALIENLRRIRLHQISIVVTCDPMNGNALAFAHELAAAFDVLKIVYCPNHGMDVMPFLKALSLVGDEIDSYDIVIKFHTKNTHSQRAIDINSIYFKYLFDDELLAEVVDQNIDLCAPLSLMRLGQNMIYRNRHNLQKILHTVDDCASGHESIDIASRIQLINSPTWLFACGTMFVLSQRVSKSLQAVSLHISQLFENENYRGKTRDDGSIAHAMERFFGLHIRLMEGTYGLMHHNSPNSLALTKSQISGNELELSCYFDKFLIKERSDQLIQLQKFSLDTSELDHACQEMHSRGLPEYNMTQIIKYYMYNDIYSVSLRSFEPSIFILQHKPVFHAKRSAFLAWLTHDSRVKCRNTVKLSFDRFWEIGLQLGLVDIDYLNFQILSSGFRVKKGSIRDFYEAVGSPLLMPSSKNFRPKDMPILLKYSIGKMKPSPLKDYISNFYLVHIYLAQNLVSNIQAQDFEGTFNTLRVLESTFGICYQTEQVNAYLSFVRGDVELAERYYRSFSRLKPVKNTKSLMPRSFLRGEAKTIGINLDKLFGSQQSE
jgi:hypothetical protein